MSHTMSHVLRPLLAAIFLASLPTSFAKNGTYATESRSLESAGNVVPATQGDAATTAVAEKNPTVSESVANVAAPEGYHFALTGPDGNILRDDDKDFVDKYLLVAFGFTACPDICPTTLYEFAEMMKTVKQPEQIQPVFITIDPLRDNPAQLNQYTGFFDKRIIGLTGDIKTIEATAKRYNATFGYRYKGKKVTPPDLPEGYTVYHSTMIYLLSPEKRDLLDVFDYQSGAEKLARDIEKAVAKNEGGDNA